MTGVTSRELILFIIYIYIYIILGALMVVVVEVIVLLVWVFLHCVLKICFDISEECTATNFRVSESVQLDT